MGVNIDPELNATKQEAREVTRGARELGCEEDYETVFPVCAERQIQ